MEKQIIFFTLLFLFSPSSNAFTLNNNIAAHYKQDEVKINVSSAECNNFAKTPTEILDLIETAINKFWNGVPTSRLSLRRGGIIDVKAAFATESICNSSDPNTGCQSNKNIKVDSDILIACNNDTTANFDSPSILASSLPNNISGDGIVGALILFNDSASTLINSQTDEELVSLIAHELGHAIGLGHSPVTDSLMFFENKSNRVALGADDVNGVTYLYPRGQPFGPVCGSIHIIDDNNRTNYLFTVTLLAIVILSLKRRPSSKVF